VWGDVGDFRERNSGPWTKSRVPFFCPRVTCALKCVSLAPSGERERESEMDYSQGIEDRLTNQTILCQILRIHVCALLKAACTKSALMEPIIKVTTFWIAFRATRVLNLDLETVYKIKARVLH
jgi:hypothetical protein